MPLPYVPPMPPAESTMFKFEYLLLAAGVISILLVAGAAVFLLPNEENVQVPETGEIGTAGIEPQDGGISEGTGTKGANGGSGTENNGGGETPQGGESGANDGGAGSGSTGDETVPPEPEPEPKREVCGNGTCGAGEDCSNCAYDCQVPEGRHCCSGIAQECCSDSHCYAGTRCNAHGICEGSCGNGTCEAWEDAEICLDECPASSLKQVSERDILFYFKGKAGSSKFKIFWEANKDADKEKKAELRDAEGRALEARGLSLGENSVEFPTAEGATYQLFFSGNGDEFADWITVGYGGKFVAQNPLVGIKGEGKKVYFYVPQEANDFTFFANTITGPKYNYCEGADKSAKAYYPDGSVAFEMPPRDYKTDASWWNRGAYKNFLDLGNGLKNAFWSAEADFCYWGRISLSEEVPQFISFSKSSWFNPKEGTAAEKYDCAKKNLYYHEFKVNFTLKDEENWKNIPALKSQANWFYCAGFDSLAVPYYWWYPASYMKDPKTISAWKGVVDYSKQKFGTIWMLDDAIGYKGYDLPWWTEWGGGKFKGGALWPQWFDDVGWNNLYDYYDALGDFTKGAGIDYYLLDQEDYTASATGGVSSHWDAAYYTAKGYKKTDVFAKSQERGKAAFGKLLKKNPKIKFAFMEQCCIKMDDDIQVYWLRGMMDAMIEAGITDTTIAIIDGGAMYLDYFSARGPAYSDWTEAAKRSKEQMNLVFWSNPALQEAKYKNFLSRNMKWSYQTMPYFQNAEQKTTGLQQYLTPATHSAQKRAFATETQAEFIFDYVPTFATFPKNYQVSKGYSTPADITDYVNMVGCGRLEKAECGFFSTCGNSACDSSNGETTGNCPWDCRG